MELHFNHWYGAFVHEPYIFGSFHKAISQNPVELSMFSEKMPHRKMQFFWPLDI